MPVDQHVASRVWLDARSEFNKVSAAAIGHIRCCPRLGSAWEGVVQLAGKQGIHIDISLKRDIRGDLSKRIFDPLRDRWPTIRIWLGSSRRLSRSFYGGE